jgi:hypothetical protein
MMYEMLSKFKILHIVDILCEVVRLATQKLNLKKKIIVSSPRI